MTNLVIAKKNHSFYNKSLRKILKEYVFTEHLNNKYILLNNSGTITLFFISNDYM